MNCIEKKIEEEYCLMSLASILLKRPVLWLSLLAPPLLHILGLRLLHLLLTCAALFFFLISLPHSSIPLSKQDQDQERDYVATKDITGKLKENLKMTNEEDEDGAIPDDECLIELSLPSGHYVGHHYTSNKNNICFHNNKVVVQDSRLFDLLTEFDDFFEEDNLIEIDISIGSIKYSRFEIKA